MDEFAAWNEYPSPELLLGTEPFCEYQREQPGLKHIKVTLNASIGGVKPVRTATPDEGVTTAGNGRRGRERL